MPPLNLVDRWDRIGPLLDAALSMSLEERASWLASLHEQDPATADDVEALLEDHRALNEQRFLDQPALNPLPGAALPGRTIGAYTLIAPIGEGGMGTVWLANGAMGKSPRKSPSSLSSPKGGGWTGVSGSCENGSSWLRSTIPRSSTPSTLDGPAKANRIW